LSPSEFRSRKRNAKHHHILNAASNLLGSALVIVTGLHIAGTSTRTLADEIAWSAAGFLSRSTLFSYIAIGREPEDSRFAGWADRVFLAGLICLVLAVLALAVTKL
jgi:hypothetical protein